MRNKYIKDIIVIYVFEGTKSKIKHFENDEICNFEIINTKTQKK